MQATLPRLDVIKFPTIQRDMLTTLQVNLGYRCNQTCVHCHVNAGPKRTEMMDAEVLALIPQVLQHQTITTLDITGGAPELHEGFRELVCSARALGARVIDRCNLTVLFEPGQENTAEFLADQRVEITASLPCYSMSNVDQQRGDGVFEKSIAALQLLNKQGYGQEGSGLILNLVYNPIGPFLPPGQEQLQAAYKHELFDNYGVLFNQLFALANMPVKRFGSLLISKGQFDGYLQLLQDNFSESNLDSVMCRSLVSVDWQGWLYDCDFNQQLQLNITGAGERLHLRDLLKNDLRDWSIRVAGHCYGCTAGQGSSCGGAL